MTSSTILPGATPQAAMHAAFDVIRSLEPQVARQLQLLRPVATSWQPSDCLPDSSADTWIDDLASLRAQARAISDDLLVVLVGDMVTEEALPSYSLALNRLVRAEHGASLAPWARWLRGWTAEENRHGDVLNAYLRLSGRVDMRAVERTVQALITDGFDPEDGGDPYQLLVYTSFQERATRISHGNVGRLADRAGDATLGRICRLIAGDEARHETFYTQMMSAVMNVDPAGGISAFAAMMRRQIAMPGRLMTDGRGRPMFDAFSAAADDTGVYTALDYVSILEHLLATWRVASVSVSGDAARHQDELCMLPGRLRRFADRLATRKQRRALMSFPWLAPGR
ncbi:MAG TPA: acyl-ACP desaturase [Vicinamibacterales bacterium]